MIPKDKITEIYYQVDEFSKNFEKIKQGHILETPKKRKYKQRNKGMKVVKKK